MTARRAPAAATRVSTAMAERLERLAADGSVSAAQSSRAAGVVHSVFARAGNVELADGRLLALHGPGPLRAPFALAMDRWPPPHPLITGMPVIVERACLVVGTSSIRWSTATSVDLRITSNGLEDESPSAAGVAKPERAGRHLPWRRLDEPGAPPAAALLAPHGAAATGRLARGIARNDRGSFVDAATALIGLGEGLTPAGDDCVSGALAVLHRMRHPLLEDPGVVRALRRAAWTRTTDLGREFLLHAVDGAFAEAVLDVASGGLDRVARGIAALLALGASSGADTLHGMRLAARALGLTGWPITASVEDTESPTAAVED